MIAPNSFSQKLKHGDRGHHTDRLRVRYGEALRTRKKHPPRRSDDPLLSATGDPLARTDPAAVKILYGLVGAARPSVRMRKIAAETWGSPDLTVIDLALDMRRAFRWSASRAAEEAVVLAAERGIFLGSPVSFDQAVKQVRKAVGKRGAEAHPHAVPGFTGRFIAVRSGTMASPDDPKIRLRLKVRDPATMKLLPEEGALVPDDLYWRRRLEQGDVIATSPPAEKKGQLSNRES